MAACVDLVNLAKTCIERNDRPKAMMLLYKISLESKDRETCGKAFQLWELLFTNMKFTGAAENARRYGMYLTTRLSFWEKHQFYADIWYSGFQKYAQQVRNLEKNVLVRENKTKGRYVVANKEFKLGEVVCLYPVQYLQQGTQIMDVNYNPVKNVVVDDRYALTAYDLTFPCLHVLCHPGNGPRKLPFVGHLVNDCMIVTEDTLQVYFEKGEKLGNVSTVGFMMQNIQPHTFVPMIATRTIQEGEELCYLYGPQGWGVTLEKSQIAWDTFCKTHNVDEFPVMKTLMSRNVEVTNDISVVSVWDTLGNLSTLLGVAADDLKNTNPELAKKLEEATKLMSELLK